MVDLNTVLLWYCGTVNTVVLYTRWYYKVCGTVECVMLYTVWYSRVYIRLVVLYTVW